MKLLHAILVIVVFGAVSGGIFLSKTWYAEAPRITMIESETASAIGIPENEITPEQKFHVNTPEHVRGIYVSGWTAGTLGGMNRIFDIIDETGINTIVLDIKDATGRLSYQPLDEELRAIGSGTNRIRDLASLMTELHEKNIYVIGRLQVFQDPYFSEKFPNEAIKDIRTGDLWLDKDRLSYIRPDSRKGWEYTARIARDAYDQGFDEIQIDYVRFPSDGNLSTMDLSDFEKNKLDTIEEFFAYMDQELRKQSGIPLSADLFGLVLTSHGDIGVGQDLTRLVPYVDYVSPMIYPSHFAPGSYGYLEPARHPYEIINKSLLDGIDKLNAMSLPPETLRPWLQDFNMGASYTADMVKAQIDGARDAGINSWLMWDARNIYTPSGFK